MVENEFPTDATTYNILEAGSCVSELLEAEFSGPAQSDTEVKLNFNTFTFEAEDDQLALKCNIKLCLKTDDTCNFAAQETQEDFTCQPKYSRAAWWSSTYDA